MRRAVLVVALFAVGCESSTGAVHRDAGGGGADGGEPDAGSLPDAAADECVTEPFQGVRGCDVMGYSQVCDGRDHVPAGTPIQWVDNPPHSGTHYPDPEPVWGEHDEVVPRGTWIANLEIGGVVLLHDCSTPCERDLDVLRAVIAARPDARILMTPDPELLDGNRFAAVSWTWAWSFDAPDEQDLLCFVDEHEGLAPEAGP